MVRIDFSQTQNSNIPFLDFSKHLKRNDNINQRTTVVSPFRVNFADNDDETESTITDEQQRSAR